MYPADMAGIKPSFTVLVIVQFDAGLLYCLPVRRQPQSIFSHCLYKTPTRLLRLGNE